MRTPIPHAVAAALIAAGLMACYPERTAAQPTAASAPEPLFMNLSIEEALAESKRTKRLLIVYPRKAGVGFDRMDARTWTHPGLRAWLDRHAVVCKVDASEDPRTYAALSRMSAELECVMREDLPIVLLFRDGRYERAIPHERMQNWSWMGPLAAGGERFKPNPKVFYPKPAQMLFALQMHLEGLASTDPLWLAAHERRNPAPPAPPLTLLHDADDGRGERVADPRAAGTAGVLERWRSAREAATAGELHRATGLYTWLWERAPELAPASAAARAAVLIPEVRILAGRRDATRARFEAVRSALEARQPWWSYTEYWEWSLLGAAIGDEGAVIELADVLMADPLELPLLTNDDRDALELIAEASVLVSGPADAAAPEALAWVRRQAQRLGASGPGAESSELERVRRRVVLDMACRLHAACLARGDAEGAALMEAAALRAAPEADARAALLWTALLAGVVGPEHTGWLEREAMRGADPALADAVREAAGQKAR